MQKSFLYNRETKVINPARFAHRPFFPSILLNGNFMRFTRFTDLSMRVLMYLTYEKPRNMVTVAELSHRFNWSRHHVVKVVNFMSRQGWIAAHRGRGGGVMLARPANELLVGDIVRTLEGDRPINQCDNPECALKPACNFLRASQEATDAFYAHLNKYSLATLTGTPEMLELIEGLHTRPFNARVFAKQEEARAASRRRRAARNAPTADFHVDEEDIFTAPPIPVEKA